MTLDDAVAKIHKDVPLWEKGDKTPTIPQLRKAAKAYHRPLAVFFLPEPPRDFHVPNDYRQLPERDRGISPSLALAIRTATDMRDAAVYMASLLDDEPARLPFTIKVSENRDTVAHRIREWLDVSVSEQKQWGAGYSALNHWKQVIESKGILVFQMEGVPLDEARGFSLHFDQFPVIAVNPKDSVNGRIFSLFHELTHLLLANDGICDFRETAHPISDEGMHTESFCNGVAASVLVPADHLISEQLVVANRNRPSWDGYRLGQIANLYGVSEEVILRRLLTLRLTTADFYEYFRARLHEQYEQRPAPKASGGPPPHSRAISNLGRRYIGLMLDAYNHRFITTSDLSGYLGIRLKHLPKIEQELTSVDA